MANENKKITLAVRANNEIKDCTWIHLDTEDEYRLALMIKTQHVIWKSNVCGIDCFTNFIFICSEGKKKNGVEVSIEKFSKSDKTKTFCKIEIDKVNISYNK